jgi:hypothetical protein
MGGWEPQTPVEDSRVGLVDLLRFPIGQHQPQPATQKGDNNERI